MSLFISSLIISVFFYGICFYITVRTYTFSKLKELIKSFNKKTISVLVILFLLAIGMVFLITKQNEYIYFWDYSSHWIKTIDRIETMSVNSVINNLLSLRNSINFDEHSVLIPSIIALPLRIIGCTFTRYVVVTFTLFYIPAILVQGLIGVRLLEDYGKRHNISLDKLFIISVAISFLFSSNYFSVLAGYMDIAFIFPLSILMLQFIKVDMKKISIKESVYIGYLLMLLWIMRRYVVFFIISYIVVLFFAEVSRLKKDEDIKKSIINIIINFAIVGATSLGILVVVFRPFLINALLSDFGKMFSAYDATTTDKIFGVIYFFGYSLIAIISIIGIMCFVKKIYRRLYLSLIAICILSPLMFFRIQAMGLQHMTLLNVPIIMILLLGINFINFKDLKKGIISILCIFVLILNFVYSMFVGRFVQSMPVLRQYVFGYYHSPYVRDDIDNIQKLDDYLNRLTSGTDNHIYIVASGIILNDEILRNINIPTVKNSIPSAYPSYHVDLRDGFNSEFFDAKYVVATSPIETHLNTGQEIIRYLSELIQDPSSYIGRHYKEIYRITLDANVDAIVYEKTTDFSNEDYENLSDYYTKLYPGYESLFRDRIISRKQ